LGQAAILIILSIPSPPSDQAVRIWLHLGPVALPPILCRKRKVVTDVGSLRGDALAVGQLRVAMSMTKR